MEYSKSYTYLFKNVQSCTDLNWSEKAILSTILTTIINGKSFKLTDSQIQKALDIDDSRISSYISKLKKRGIITATTVRVPSHSGGKPTPQRTIEVIDIESWVIDSKKPVFERLNPIKKRKPKTAYDRKKSKAKEVEVEKNTNDKLSVTLENKDNKIDVVDTSDNEYIKVNCDDCLHKSNDIQDLIDLHTDFENQQPVNIIVDFGNDELTSCLAYFCKQINGVDKYILSQYVADYQAKEGMYE